MYQIELAFTDPNSLLSEIAKSYQLRINVLDCKFRYRTKGCDELIEIIDEHDKWDEIIKTLEIHSDITSTKLIHTKRNILLCAITTSRTDNCSIFHTIECFRLSHQINESGIVTWKLIFPDERKIKDLFTTMKQKGLDPKLVRKSWMTAENVLTIKQEKILDIAYHRGYFDYPKRINIRELARIFEISISTMSEIIRKGEKKIVGTYFNDIA